MRTLLAIALLPFLTGACASGGLPRSTQSDPLAKYDGYIGEPVRSFTAMRMQSWQPVSSDRLILWTGLNDAWLITLQGNCPDLNFAHTVSVTSTGSSVSTFDTVLVGRNRCPIKQINPIDVRQMKADRAADKKSEAEEAAKQATKEATQ